MGWVRSPPFFCAASETAAYLANSYLANNFLPTPEYGSTLWAYSTVASPPASAGRLQAADVYMDDLNYLTQGIPDQQRRVTEMVLQGIKDIFPSLPFELKDSVSLKKSQKGYVNWEVDKEIMGWILNSEEGKSQLPSHRLKELKSLLAISPSQRRLPVSKLRSLIGKLRSMHIALPGAIGHFFFIQKALTKAGTASKAYLSKAFHW